ncbi:GH3 Auxin-Responsive Promoter [Blattabacterium sp. (Nauphoeta cinerea)]|uniref:GH3 auxin-responsive promoter family protein n=1 Tax=Blattabacterium sp. (Nauphoeta cinerea) TaxID=1316444 RepID=UPI0003B0228B|nr:GH3 auxin-responsive promoter family protein [Blattabacterium sp. (Nauphoeta cinerea)]AGW85888.1 GH3 Auxin-Responsive Promoter [Blattabacterium sp. (Nauphoeta cinerea)]
MIKYLSGYFTSSFLKKRIKSIEFFMRYPIEIQNQLMNQLVLYAKNTEFGKKYGFCDIKKYQQFSERIPICKYTDLQYFIKRIRSGEKNILWPGKVKWFARSSGTTNTRSKYIPITKLSMNTCHYKAGKDVLSIYIHNHPKTKIFFGKAVRLGGSYELHKKYNTFYGDLSSILIQNMPFWVENICVPRKKIALISEWEKKLENLVKETGHQDVRILLGVCSWLLIFLNKLLKEFDKKIINEIWPNIEVIFHGGVSLRPYILQYQKLFNKSINYYDVYSASEGFFAIQDQKNVKDLLLLLNHGIFYEFIPTEEINNSDPKILSIDKVELNKNYALVISTNAGLWRYIVGDTVRFTSLSPYRILISGRTTHYINSFGEELIVENTEKALNKACMKTNSTIHEYTVGPVYMNTKNSGAHEWIIEFEKKPKNLCDFINILDNELKYLNSDYEVKRYKNIVLGPPIIYVARNGLFYDWLKKHNKLGGQNKVPRLSNDRRYIDSILEMEKSRN